MMLTVIRYAPSQSIWEVLLKILIKSNKLRISTETVLDIYTEKFEYSLKKQERLDRTQSTANL